MCDWLKKLWQKNAKAMCRSKSRQKRKYHTYSLDRWRCWLSGADRWRALACPNCACGEISMNKNHHSPVCGTLGLDKYAYNVVRLAKLKKPRPSPACDVIAHFVRFKRALSQFVTQWKDGTPWLKSKEFSNRSLAISWLWHDVFKHQNCVAAQNFDPSSLQAASMKQ